ncbi:sugar phosphate isomerase/epimerase family protein [Novosphingobium malaysiense]|uniref:Xylose isomerase-like TIM barrel domain-containing protein n=1 Tax=Novosphingobium malaysiense TaxID=1348853 RepID=A0A0B1ZU54_9SPHN|nr:TIM barrel protein [Novosphingobium malaysiense]KHK92657.1 hypothetical protein LK12_07845 [Novosphingobium malaysiense]
MRKFALHQITAIELPPDELIRLAAEVGCDRVCVFVRSPLVVSETSGREEHLFPTITVASVETVRQALDETGGSIMNIEYFPIEDGVDLETYRDALALGASLGAERIVTHMHETDPELGRKRLGLLCDMAAEFGLKVGLEFMGLSPGCNSIAMAQEIVADVARPNLGIAIDALHLARTGGTIRQVADLPPSMIAYAQLCDGEHLRTSNDYLPEAMDRMLPGTGVFPLRELVAALPDDTPYDVEVPGERLRESGVDAKQRAQWAVEACAKLFK